MSAAKSWGVPKPVRLVPGERVIWRGAPGWRSVALRVFHVRLVAGYFVLLTLADMVQTRFEQLGRLAALRAAVPGTLTGAGALLILLALAWATGRTTRYTVTDQRIVMQFGLALPATLSLPLHRIAAAGLRVRDDHVGDIALRLWPGERIGFSKLWPHVRPWRFGAPEPMLRDVPRVATIAAPLCRAIAAAAQRAREAAAGATVPAQSVQAMLGRAPADVTSSVRHSAMVEASSVRTDSRERIKMLAKQRARACGASECERNML